MHELQRDLIADLKVRAPGTQSPDKLFFQIWGDANLDLHRENMGSGYYCWLRSLDPLHLARACHNVWVTLASAFPDPDRWAVAPEFRCKVCSLGSPRPDMVPCVSSVVLRDPGAGFVVYCLECGRHAERFETYDGPVVGVLPDVYFEDLFWDQPKPRPKPKHDEIVMPKIVGAATRQALEIGNPENRIAWGKSRGGRLKTMRSGAVIKHMLCPACNKRDMYLYVDSRSPWAHCAHASCSHREPIRI